MGTEHKGKLQQFNYKKTKEEEAEDQKEKFGINTLLSDLTEKLNGIKIFNKNETISVPTKKNSVDEYLTHDANADN